MENEPEIVQFGCLRCKRTNSTQAIDSAAENALLLAFEVAFEIIQKQGDEAGVNVSDDLRKKLLKWGVKQSILPKDAAKRLQIMMERNKLD